MSKNIELLSPAGSFDKLKIAFKYGADAVYLGGKAFNLRAKSSNFSKAGLKEATDYAHSIGKKVYTALNIIAHDKEINALPSFVKYLEEIGVDAVIVADMGVFDLVQEHSDLPIHVSTQSSTTNWMGVRMWQRLGAKRIILAREVTIDEIKKIKDKVPDMEIEVFVHGSMCMTYSGRCNLSNYFSERDGNRGVCSNTCRWKYNVVEEKRPGEYFPVYEDETGTYMYNSKDLCTIEFVDKLLDAGIDGLKIEGRMKSLMYCAVTAKAYRNAIDSYLSGAFRFDPRWLEELKSFSHRGYTSGFYLGGLDKNSEQLAGGYYLTHKFLGLVRKKTEDQGHPQVLIDILEKVESGTEIEALKSGSDPYRFVIDEMIQVPSEKQITVAQPNMQIRINDEFDLDEFDVLRIPVGEQIRPSNPSIKKIDSMVMQ